MVDIQQSSSSTIPAGSKFVELNRRGHHCTMNTPNIYEISNLALSVQDSPEKVMNMNGVGSTFSIETSSFDSGSPMSPISPNTDTVSESEVAAGGRLEVRPMAPLEDKKTRRWLTHTAQNCTTELTVPADTEYGTISIIRKRSRHSVGAVTQAPTSMQNTHAHQDNWKHGGGTHNHTIITEDDDTNKNNNNDACFITKQPNQRKSVTKSVRWSNVIQMKDVKFIIAPDSHNKRCTKNKKLSVSEIAGNRLYLKGVEREKRLALLRKSYHLKWKKDGYDKVHSPYQTSNCCIDTCQRLYNLSRPMQEEGKKRRETIVKEREKGKDVFVHPPGKISINAATRLYRDGMKKLISLEQRRSMASDSKVFKSYLIRKVDKDKK